MKKETCARLVGIALITGVCLLITFIFLKYQLGNQLDYFLAFKQQNLAATTIWESNPLKTIGFWRWGTEPSESIYTSYPATAYLLKSILAKTLREVDISTIAILLGLSSIYLMSMLMYFAINERPSSSGGLGVAPAILFATNPSLLAIIPEPDWPESFLVTSLIGLVLWKYNKKITGMIAIIASFTIYFPSALSVLAWRFSKGALRLFSDIHSPLKRALIRDKPPSGATSEFSLLTDAIPIALFAGIGACTYFLWRKLAEAACMLQGLKVTGSQLLTRIGIDPQDAHYGGIFNVLRFLLPIPNRLASPADLVQLWQPENFYSKLNIASLAVSHLIIALIGISAAFDYLLQKSNNKLLMRPEKHLSQFLFFYGTSAIPLLFLMPQMMSVHFRLTDRLLAPFISVGICIALKDGSNKLAYKRSTAQAFYRFAISLITIEQIRFFFSFYFPVSATN